MSKPTDEDQSGWGEQARHALDRGPEGDDGVAANELEVVSASAFDDSASDFDDVPAHGSGVHQADRRLKAQATDDKNACDRRKFEAIARQHRPYLMRRAAHYCGNIEAAKDLVQDTLVRGLKNFDSFEDGTDAQAWLATILVRLFLDSVKHNMVVSNASIQISASMGSGEYEMPIDSVSNERLTRAIELLDLRHQAVIKCCYFKEMKYKDAAKQLGVPVGTIGTRLKSALQRLKEILSQDLKVNGERRDG
jgi:RNA polymerase sigma-70 factor (ECF subfamily)